MQIVRLVSLLYNVPVLQDLAVHRLWAHSWNLVRRRSLMNCVGLNIVAGPCRVLDPNGPKYHPESWTSNANIFFVDQPIGVGYSYADNGESVVRLKIPLLLRNDIHLTCGVF